MKNKFIRKTKNFIAISLVVLITLTSGVLEQISSVDFSSIFTINAQATSSDIPIGAMSKIVSAYISVEDSGNFVDISAYEIPSSNVEDLITALKETYPFVFSILRISYYLSTKEKNSDGTYIINSIQINTYGNVSQYQSKYSELTAVTDSVLESTDGMTDFEKVVYAYNYIILNTSYDNSLTKYTAYNALVEGSAVCEGYAQAFFLLMDVMKINCVVVDSYLMNHSWNMVELDGQWYHLDATFDDSNDNSNNSQGRAEYSYFLLNDTEIKETNHYGWSSDYTSTGTAYSNMPRYSNNVQTYSGDLWYYYLNDSLYSSDQYGENVSLVADITGDGIAIVEDICGEKYIIYGSSTTLILHSLSDSSNKTTIYNIGDSYRYYSLFLSGTTIKYYYDNSTSYSTNASSTAQAASTEIELSKYLNFEIASVSTISCTSGSTWLKLSWNEVSGATGYQIFINDFEVATIIDGETTYKISDLVSGTDFSVQIRAFLQGSTIIYSDYSNTFTFATYPPQVNISSAQSTYDSITLNWEEIDSADGYRIYELVDGVWSSVITLSSQYLSYIITDLNENTKYTYKIKAYTRDSDGTAQFGEASEEYSVKTNSTKVEIIYYESFFNVISIYWNEVVDADGYRVYIYQNGSWEAVCTIENSSITYYQFTGLEEGVEYNLKVKAYIIDSSETILWQQASDAFTATTQATLTNLEIVTGFPIKNGTIISIVIDKCLELDSDKIISTVLKVMSVCQPVFIATWLWNLYKLFK